MYQMTYNICLQIKTSNSLLTLIAKKRQICDNKVKEKPILESGKYVPTKVFASTSKSRSLI